MDSPLTRQARPDTFEPKIVQLYRQLFSIDNSGDLEDTIPQEGFWRELFSLKPEKEKFSEVLEPLTADHLLHFQHQTRSFFRRAIEEAGSGIFPRNENALENLTGFLNAVLDKKYTNPSTDVIEVLAGLSTIDKLVSDLVQGLEAIIRSSQKPSFRHKAIDTALAMVSGSYQTSLVTYFIHRDLFPALMKYVQEVSEPTAEAIILLGLLANYNKFESQNLYQNRLEDFVNESTIKILVAHFASVIKDVRDQYVNLQDDSPAPWSLSSTLSFVGLRALSTDQKKPPPSEEEARNLFNALPAPTASIILAAYSFIQANQIFASTLLSTSTDIDHESPLSLFLSTTSYFCHHAYRSHRASHYAILSLLSLRILIGDTVQAARLASNDTKILVRLARQRPPHLPLVSSPRIPATAVLDICTDCISHNLRKRINAPLYNISLTNLHHLLTHLDLTKIRLQHHWPYLWGSLFSLLRFLTQYANDLTPAYQIRAQICTPLTTILAFCLSRGDNFLPDPASYDDLFYKLIEATDILPKFRDAYCPTAKPPKQTSTVVSGPVRPDTLTLATNALLSVTSHYQSLLSSSGRRTHQSPATVQKIIKEGYETLPDLQSSTDAATNRAGLIGGTAVPVDFAHRDKWRESEWKADIKKIVRTVVEDSRLVALRVRS